MKNYNNFCITINEDVIFKHYFEHYYSLEFGDVMINENLFDTLKSNYDKAKEVVKNVPDAAKKSLETIIDAAKDATDFVKNIITQLNAYIQKILTETVSKIKEKLKSNDIFRKALEGIIKEKKESLIKDLNMGAELINFYTDKFKGIISSKISDAFTKSVTSEEVTESLDFGKNVIGTLIHKLEQFPPFSYLNKVKEFGEQGANTIIGGVSYFTKQIGGPEIAMPVIAALIGIAIEYNVKGLVKSGLLDIIGLATVPVIATLIKVIGWIATTIAVIMVIDDIGEFNIIKHSHEHKQKEHQPKLQPQTQQPLTT